MTLIGKVWRGDLPLQETFWNWAFAGGLIVNLLSSVLFLMLMMAGQLVLALIVGYGFSVPYNIIVTVGVWRAADRYDGERKWADMAKLATVAGMILLSVT